MIGIDPGLNVGSITAIVNKQITYQKVLKFDYWKSYPNYTRAWKVANVVYESLPYTPVIAARFAAVEEPFYSHGRSNPRTIAPNFMMFGVLVYLLENNGYTVRIIHNRTAKKIARLPSKHTKEDVIRAYKERVGEYPPHKTKYGRETLADSYFIALAGLDALKRT